MEGMGMAIKALQILGWVIGLGFLGGVSYYAYTLGKYKIKFRIRKITGTHNIVIDDRAKIIKIGKKGKSVTKWALKRQKENIPIPPDEAISIDSKGRMIVEAYSTSQGQYQYIVPKASVKTLEPLNTDDKSFYAEEFADSLKYKSTDWSGVIMMVTQGVILVTVLVLALIFVNQIIEPAGLVADKLVAAIESAKQCQAIVPINAP